MIVWENSYSKWSKVYVQQSKAQFSCHREGYMTKVMSWCSFFILFARNLTLPMIVGRWGLHHFFSKRLLLFALTFPVCCFIPTRHSLCVRLHNSSGMLACLVVMSAICSADTSKLIKLLIIHLLYKHNHLPALDINTHRWTLGASRSWRSSITLCASGSRTPGRPFDSWLSSCSLRTSVARFSQISNLK